jgi:tetratricopeptide (TPR) repeat protein/predicted Ser/Thr protein kinase
VETIAASGTTTRGTSQGVLDRGTMLGRYVLLGRLGSGGMGVVYAAYDPELDRKIAIKLVLDDHGRMEDRARLQREAQALAKIHHPNIAAVFDVGTHDAAVFVAMEFVDGETLASWEKRRGVPVPWREAIEVYAQAGRGLAAAHAAGVVHRDFKPHNAMRDRTGRVVVLDFGLARPAKPTAGPDAAPSPAVSSTPLGPPDLTIAGSVVGTPAYMSPEQLAGETAGAASDQFSFCVALWRAVFGEAPFAGTTMTELASSVLRRELRPPPRSITVPKLVREALERGLAREPEARHPSMDALLAALQRDGARAPRRIATVVVAATALAGAVWAGQRVAREDPCAAPAERLDRAWGEQRRSDVARSLRAGATAYSEETKTRVESSVDDVTRRWWSARQSACTARDTSTAGLVRTRCLDEQLVQIDAITRVLAGIGAERLDRAPAVLHLLPNPSLCDEVDVTRDAPALPDDPLLQEQVQALRARTFDCKAIVELGEMERALEMATAIHEEALAVGVAPLIAETGLVLGRTLLLTQRYEEAVVRFEEALLAAQAIDHDEVILVASIHLAFLHTNHTLRYDLAEWLLRDAEALASRFPDRPVTLGEVAMARARLAFARDDLDAGLRAATDAVALLERVPDQGFAIAIAHQTVVQLHLARGEYAAADEALSRGAEAASRALGDPHPLRADFLLARAQIATRWGKSSDAIELLQQAMAIYEDAHGPDSLGVAAAYNGLGLVLEGEGQRARAVDAFTTALEIHRRRDERAPRDMSLVAANAGNALRRSGRASDAIALHREALALIEPVAGRDGASVLPVRENLADDLRAAGRCSEAESEYRAILEVRERDATPSTDASASAYATVGLGLCRLEAGALADAVALLRRAVAMHVAASRCDAEAGVASFALAIALRRAGLDVAEVDAEIATARRCFTGPPKDTPALAELDRFAGGEAIASPNY